MTDGFLSRWSKRKLDVQEGKPVLAEPPPHPLQPSPQPAPAGGRGSEAAAAGGTASEASAFSARGRDNPGRVASPPLPPGEGRGEGAPEVPLPTLADAQALTPQSDFKPFMVRGVAADVKNAAMKKLFSDPHYNVMDRLDTYIDDYSISDPIPEAMLRKMVSAKFLNLFDEEKAPEARPATDVAELARDVPDTAAPETVAQSPLPLEAPKINDDNTDLQLQPDHAAPAPDAGRGT